MTQWISWNSSWLSKLLQSRTGCHIHLRQDWNFHPASHFPFTSEPLMHHLEVLVLGTGSTQGMGESAVSRRPPLSYLPCRFAPSASWQSCSLWPSRFCTKRQKIYSSFLDRYGRNLRFTYQSYLTQLNFLSGKSTFRLSEALHIVHRQLEVLVKAHWTVFWVGVSPEDDN